MDYCDSLEKGVITMYNDIISSINSEYDMLLEEADIDSIIKGKTQYYEEAVVQAVETMVQNFVTDLLNSIRERGIDTNLLIRCLSAAEQCFWNDFWSRQTGWENIPLSGI